MGILRESSEGERRVSMIPEVVVKAKNLGLEVIVEKNAGISSFYDNEEYVKSGAVLAESRDEIFSSCDIITTIQRPSSGDLEKMRAGTFLIGMIYPMKYPEVVRNLASNKITTFSLERMPRTTRAQSMDVLSSQSSTAGYMAAVMAASNSPRLIPMLTTAAGVIRPSKALVIGAGVSGLMAIATLKRMGASITAFDVRRSAGDDVRSLGAKFLDLGMDAIGEGGYARDLTESEKKVQQDRLSKAIAESDIVITSAGVPGRPAPIIVTSAMVQSMKKGSVIVDIAAESGGNCELTSVGRIIEHNGVRIVGNSNLPAETPISSSEMFSRNVLSFVLLLVDDNGNLSTEFSDNILRSCLVTHNGKIFTESAKSGSVES